jgi:ABC-type amino acid transport system permease subunit
MALRTPVSLRARTAVGTAIALLISAALLVAVPLVPLPANTTWLGLPLRVALALAVGLPVLVLTMFWFAMRQSLDEDRFSHDG